MALTARDVARSLDSFEARQYRSWVAEMTIAFTDHLGASRTANATFRPGLSVVTGGNGAGKTTLLRAIHLALNAGSGAPPTSWPARLESVHIRGTHGSAEWELKVGPGGDGGTEILSSSGVMPDGIFYIDPASDTQEVLTTLAADDDIDSLLSGVDPSEMDED